MRAQLKTNLTLHTYTYIHSVVGHCNTLPVDTVLACIRNIYLDSVECYTKLLLWFSIGKKSPLHFLIIRTIVKKY